MTDRSDDVQAWLEPRTEEMAELLQRLVAVNCDEETGSAAGSGHLREAELIDRDALAMLTAEPTGGVIWHACRGAITLRVQTAGREAHVGYVHEGVNAFEHMIRADASPDPAEYSLASSS